MVSGHLEFSLKTTATCACVKVIERLTERELEVLYLVTAL